MASWIRRPFSAPGLTQKPPGPKLRMLQGRFGGTVMLCIDVSGSMDGPPILEAVRGAPAVRRRGRRRPLRRRRDALEHPGGGGVRTEPRREGGAGLLAPVDRARGGNYLLTPLEHCHQILVRFTGDRLVALFGDGDLTPKPEVLAKVAQMKAENIRFVTRGLGPLAAREFGEISDEEPSTASINDVDELAEGIADMATTLFF